MVNEVVNVARRCLDERAHETRPLVSSFSSLGSYEGFAELTAIAINRTDLVVSVQDESPDQPIVTSEAAVLVAAVPRSSPANDRVFDALYYGEMYGQAYREAERRGERGVRFKLIEPDPWLIAIAYVMWEGILQGLAWDAVKVAVNRAFGGAPEERTSSATQALVATTFSSKILLGTRFLA